MFVQEARAVGSRRVDAKLAALHAPIMRAQLDVIDIYDDDQLRLLVDFLDRSAEVAKQEAVRMRAPSEEVDAGGTFAARVGGVTTGRLIFLSGAPKMIVRGDPTLTDLYQARFAGPVPRM